jgi:hypothetical protein
LRLGTFDISRTDILESPELVMAITGRMLIYRAEMMFHKNSVEYIAVSDLFDEVEKGECPLEYLIIVEKTEDETYVVSACRKGKKIRM